MKGQIFILVALAVLVCSWPSYAGYKDLVMTWEDWAPPTYSVPGAAGQGPGMLTEDEEKKRASGTESFSGYRAWESKVTGLLDLGQFVRIHPFPNENSAWDVQRAQAAVGSVLRLEDLESMGLARNPAVLAASASFQGELDGFDQVADLNAVLSRYTAFTRGVMAGVGPMKGGSDMSGTYPFPGRSALKSRIVFENAAMAALSLNMTVRDKMTAIRKAYWDFGLILEKLDILRETLDILDHLYDIAETRYKAGKTSYQDLIQISIKKKVLQKQIVSSMEKRQAVGATLLSLLDLPPDTLLGRPEPRLPEMTLPGAPSLMGQALEKRQELIRTDHAISKMELMIEMAESMVLPPLDMGLSRKSPAEISTAGTWSKKEAFPVQGPPAFTGAGQPQRPWFGTADAWLSQTRKKLAALRHNRRNLEAETRALVQSAWFNLDDAVRTFRLYEESIVDLSASALDVSTKEYESGSASFAETAGTYNLWLNARLSLADAKRETGVSRADLQRIVGFSF